MSLSPLEQAYQLALQLFQAGALAETEEACRVILRADPMQAEVLLLLGTCAWQRGDAAGAVACYDQALAVKPGLAEAHFNRGLALRVLGRGVEALASYEAAIALNPAWADAYFNKGNLLQELLRPEEALAAYERAVHWEPGYASAHCNRGNALRELGRLDEALAAYQKAAELEPDKADAYFNQGELLQSCRQLEQARAAYESALRIQPQHVRALCNLGLVLVDLNEPEAALACIEQALLMEPDNPRLHNNRGVALKALDRWEEALACFTRATDLNRDYPEAFCNRGKLLHQLMRLDAAHQDYQRALALRPDDADCHFNEALRYLLLGDFDKGWAEYEWRWRLPQHAASLIAAPRWSGDFSIAGKTILIFAEQGYGDAIQFCRYIPLLAQQGAKVVLEVPSPLVPLMQRLSGAAEVVARGDKRPPFDCHCPLLSLPYALRADRQSIPSQVPYLSVAQEDRAEWAQRLGAPKGFRVGLAWSGSPTHMGDRWRSVGLEALKPLLETPGTEFFALQTEVRADDQSLLSSLPIRYMGDELKDFAHTAALVDAMDLIITVDTSVAHLAGALAKPTWVMIPFFPDWRWLLERGDSPWYPSMHLYRQAQRDAWGPVVSALTESLRQKVATP